jgi:hypothetical protein
MNPAFMDHYMSALFFPHTDMNAFPSVNEKLEEYRSMQRMARELASDGGQKEG